MLLTSVLRLDRIPWRRPASADRPPHLPGLPVLGSAVRLWRNPFDMFVEPHRTHGPIFRVKLGPNRFTVLVRPTVEEAGT